MKVNNTLIAGRALLVRTAILVLLFSLSGCASSKRSSSLALDTLNPQLEQLDARSTPTNQKTVDTEQLKAVLSDARAAYETSDWQAAQKHYQRAEALGADQETIFYWLGNLAVMSGELNAAEKYYSSALSLNPKNAKAQYNLATVHLAKAEDHFHFYTATADDEPMDQRLMKLMSAIEDFSSNTTQTKPSQTPLESLRRVLSGN